MIFCCKSRTLNLPTFPLLFTVVPVLAKLPLGLLVPTFTKDVPNDFPFKPFWRDAFITSLSVMCRGEFNVVVASFGLSHGLLDADVYSAIVMAILVSSIIGPLLLSQTIRHYNQLSEDYFSTPHLVERIKNSRDGTRPLFFAIQIRTPASWGLHEKFQHVIQDLGLMVLDHRTWHTNGLEAVAMSEIFVRDTLKSVTVKNCFEDKASVDSDISTSSSDASHKSHNSVQLEDLCAKVFEDLTAEECIEVSVGAGKANTFLGQDIQDDNQEMGHTDIEKRILQVQTALEACLGEVDPNECVIQTKQWEPFLQSTGKGHQRQHTYAFQDTGSPTNTQSVDKRHQRQPTYTFQDATDDHQSHDERHQRQPTYMFQSSLVDNHGTSTDHHLQPTNTLRRDISAEARSVGKGHHRQFTGTLQEIPTSILGAEEDDQSQRSRSLYEIPGKLFEDVSADRSETVPPVINAPNDIPSTLDVQVKDSIFLNYFKTLEKSDSESAQHEIHQTTVENQSLVASMCTQSVDPCEKSVSSKSVGSMASKNALETPAEIAITTDPPLAVLAVQNDQAFARRTHHRRTLSFCSASSKNVKTAKKKHRRVVTHGHFGGSMLCDVRTSAAIAANPNRQHRRNATQGQCYGIVVGGDLWDSDQVTRDCLQTARTKHRRDSFRASSSGSFRSNATSLAGSVPGSLQEGSHLGDNIPSGTGGGDEQFVSLLRSAQNQPASAAQQHLQGYIRHCRAEF